MEKIGYNHGLVHIHKLKDRVKVKNWIIRHEPPYSVLQSLPTTLKKNVIYY